MIAVPGRAEPLQLNATGALIWDLLRSPCDTPSLASSLALDFGRPKPEVERAVALLLDDLVAAGAVVQE